MSRRRKHEVALLLLIQVNNFFNSKKFTAHSFEQYQTAAVSESKFRMGQRKKNKNQKKYTKKFMLKNSIPPNQLFFQEEEKKTKKKKKFFF